MVSITRSIQLKKNNNRHCYFILLPGNIYQFYYENGKLVRY